MLREHIGDDADFIKEMITIYMHDMPSYLNDLNTFLNQKNWQKVSAQAHKMKSSAALFGVVDLTGLLTEIEMACKNELKEDEHTIIVKINTINDLLYTSVNELEQEYRNIA